MRTSQTETSKAGILLCFIWSRNLQLFDCCVKKARVHLFSDVSCVGDWFKIDIYGEEVN